MARRRTSLEQQRDRAHQAAQRMIARGERPAYRLRRTDAGWVVLEAPWLTVTQRSAGRAVIASWLACPPDAFDVELP